MLPGRVVLIRHIADALEAMPGPAIGVYCSLSFAGTLGLLGPLADHDTIRFTRRVVGPLYRLRRAMKAATAVEEVELPCPRKGELLQEMDDDFDAMFAVLEARGAAPVIRATRIRGPISPGADTRHATTRTEAVAKQQAQPASEPPPRHQGQHQGDLLR